MNIHLNGARHTLETETSIAALLAMLDLQQKRVAVEVNGQIIPRSEHAAVILQADDKVEVIHAIGGG